MLNSREERGGKKFWGAGWSGEENKNGEERRDKIMMREKGRVERNE